MATEEVVGNEICSIDEMLPKDEAQTSSQYMNMANKQGEEFEFRGTCSCVCSSLSAEEEEDDDDDDDDDDDVILLYLELIIRDEPRRLLKEVKIAIEQVKESKFYANLTKKIKGDAFQSQLKQVLGPYSQLNMVIYALGSLEFSFNPHYQLTLALLLKKDFSSWIGGIEVYDPAFSPTDAIVLKNLGCEVLLFNERCRRQVEKPTLFYMPYADTYLVGNLLGANWCPSLINQLIILQSSFKSYCQIGNILKTQFLGCLEDYIYAIQDYTKEIPVEGGGYGGKYDNIFSNLAFHFFEVDSHLDMETLIPDEDGELSKKRFQHQRECDTRAPTDFLWERKCSEKFFMEPFAEDAPQEDWAELHGEHRGPCWYRIFWIPPPRGWIKLNFGGRSSNNGNNLAGFGGICHNESEKPILIYRGALGRVDQTTACVEALIFGLTELLKIPNVTRNLIVEGDDLKVIQGANKRQHEHPKELHESLNRVLDLLKEFNSVVYHIYEVANSVANDLAKKGSVLGNHVCKLGQY